MLYGVGRLLVLAMVACIGACHYWIAMRLTLNIKIDFCQSFYDRFFVALDPVISCDLLYGFPSSAV